MNSSFNISELCRLCARETSASDRLNIFSNDGIIINLRLKITTCLSVTVTEQDRLPKLVCKDCNFLQSQYGVIDIKKECESPDRPSGPSFGDEYCSNYDLLLSQNDQSGTNCTDLNEMGVNVNPSNKLAENIANDQSILLQNSFKDRLTRNQQIDEAKIDTIQRQTLLKRSPLHVHEKQACKKTKSLGLKMTPSDTSTEPQPTKKLSLLKCFSTLKPARSNVVSSVPIAAVNSKIRTSASILKTSNETFPQMALTEQDSKPLKYNQTLNHKREQLVVLSSISILKKNCPIKVTLNITPSAIATSSKSSSRECLAKSKHSTRAMFQCHHCKLLFQTHEESLEHVHLLHKKVHKADGNNKIYCSSNLLAVHSDEVQSKNKTMKDCKKCKVCGKEYARKGHLEMHERSHAGEKPFSCHYCNKLFASNSSRSLHIRGHEKRWNHVCSFCGKGFIQKNNFTYHVQKHHTGERPFSCSQCESKFVRKQDLCIHQANMHSTEPRQYYKCEICNKNCATKSYLKQHLKNHEVPLESRKKFKCSICDKLLASKNSLKNHTFSHTGEPLFECDICKKRCKTKEGLKIHLLIHSGVKTFVCEFCGKAFALLNSLKCHRPTHTGERPYQCDICDQRFTQKSSLNTHRKRHA